MIITIFLRKKYLIEYLIEVDLNYIMDKSSAKRGLVNASYLTIGNLVSQVIGVFGFIYIARMLGPESYGIFVTVTSFVDYLHYLLLKD